MSQQLPTRLASEPLVEVVSEVRFDAPGDVAVNLLPGILYEKFGPFDHQGRTMPFPLPAELLGSEPSLAFRAQVAMAKDNWVIQVGPRVVSVACRAPYPGWTKFNSFVHEVFEVVCHQPFISSFNWISLKYVDVISLTNQSPSLSCLDLRIELGKNRIEAQPSSLRVEQTNGPISTVVQIALPVRTQRLDQASTEDGVLVDVDTIYRDNFSDFVTRYPEVLDQLHKENKTQFFALLTSDTLKRLNPEYT